MASLRVDQETRWHRQHRVVRQLQGAGEGGPMSLPGSPSSWDVPPELSFKAVGGDQGRSEVLTGAGRGDITLFPRHQAPRGSKHSPKPSPRTQPGGFITTCLSFSSCKTRTRLLHPWVRPRVPLYPGVQGWSGAAWGQGRGCKTWATAPRGLRVQSQLPTLRAGNAVSLQRPGKHPQRGGQGRTEGPQPGRCHSPSPRSLPASKQSCTGAGTVGRVPPRGPGGS